MSVRTTVRVAAAALLALVCVRAIGQADSYAWQPSLVVRGADDWVPVLAALREFPQALRESDADLGPDAAGLRPSQYADEWLLTPDVDEKLGKLRQKAHDEQEAGRKSALEKTLAEANHLVAVQEYRSVVLSTYGLQRSRLRKHVGLIDGLAAQLPAAEQDAARKAIEVPAQRMQASLITALKVKDDPLLAGSLMRALQDWDRSMEALNTERLRLAGLVGESNRAHGIAPRGRDRQTPCPADARQTSGKETPTLDRSSLVPLVYPAESQRLGYFGRIVLTFHVAANGCMTRSEVAESAGVTELDDAAMDWGEKIRFLPAEQNGQPVAGAFDASVTFKLTN